MNELILNRYQKKKLINHGCFGKIYQAFDIQNKKIVALKIQQIKFEKNSSVKKQKRIFDQLKGLKYVPQIYAYTFFQNQSILVMQLLGKDLGLLLKQIQRFSLKTNLMLAFNLINIIQQIHRKKIIHQDLKPENIVIGKQNQTQIYIIDFGISKNINEIRKRKIYGFIGTPRYASLAAHYFQNQEQKDDLQSLIYVLIFLAKGKLPWMNLNCIGNQRNQKIKKLKETSSSEVIAYNLPKCYSKALSYVFKIKKGQLPDYNKLKKFFQKQMIQNQMQMDYDYDWIKSINYKKKKFTNMHEHSSNSFLKNDSTKLIAHNSISTIHFNQEQLIQQEVYCELQSKMKSLKQYSSIPKFLPGKNNIFQ